MKASYTLAAAALLACATAAKPHHAHEAYHNQVRAPGVLEQRNVDNASCGCTTSYTTFYGEATLIQNIQSNTTTVQHLAISHVQITVQPVPATTATTESPIEVTSSTALPYTHTESSHLEPSSSSEIQAYSPHPSPSPSSETQAYSPHPSPSSSSIGTPIEVSYSITPYQSASSPAPYHASSPTSYQVPSSSPVSQPAAAHPSPKPKSKPKPAHSNPALGSSGSQWCMTYSPYTASGDCKPASAISSDIASIAAKGFSSIRLYSTDCSGLPTIGSAASTHGLNLILGIFISETGIPDAETQLHEITSWATTGGANWQTVELIVVGNEAVFNGYCTAPALAAFIHKAKSAFRAAGYAGPVTTTEPINVLQEHAATLCPALDVAAANIHPFFNADVAAEGAGPFVAKELALLESVCPGLEAYNLETGWPSAGEANGAACPGVEEQRTAVESIREHVGGRCAFFSFEDDLWKAEGEFAVERSWGCSQLFGD
ncbi:MAG: hypothetical protein HETSPECPRED_001100 [Heterodermia speciosa]|uniref:Probable beta-glucosidase btgE n=1 Tax=Heterodermia speciosa TaxID=116794 RepID=A0A8H3J0M9_9LECA|nr:MAG: hypothetical protein HETSPECPRED_001100 [Heterodermia speciosa]